MENKKEDEKELEEDTSYSKNEKDCGMHLTVYAVYCIAGNAVGNFFG